MSEGGVAIVGLEKRNGAGVGKRRVTAMTRTTTTPMEIDAAVAAADRK
jgi:hypothetical protein